MFTELFRDFLEGGSFGNLVIADCKASGVSVVAKIFVEFGCALNETGLFACFGNAFGEQAAGGVLPA